MKKITLTLSPADLKASGFDIDEGIPFNTRPALIHIKSCKEIDTGIVSGSFDQLTNVFTLTAPVGLKFILVLGDDTGKWVVVTESGLESTEPVDLKSCVYGHTLTSFVCLADVDVPNLENR